MIDRRRSRDSSCFFFFFFFKYTRIRVNSQSCWRDYDRAGSSVALVPGQGGRSHAVFVSRVHELSGGQRRSACTLPFLHPTVGRLELGPRHHVQLRYLRCDALLQRATQGEYPIPNAPSPSSPLTPSFDRGRVSRCRLAASSSCTLERSVRISQDFPPSPSRNLSGCRVPSRVLLTVS